jgi:hypothetical protein
MSQQRGDGDPVQDADTQQEVLQCWLESIRDCVLLTLRTAWGPYGAPAGQVALNNVQRQSMRAREGGDPPTLVETIVLQCDALAQQVSKPQAHHHTTLSSSESCLALLPQEILSGDSGLRWR